jgi:hypothetical protein
MDSEDAKRLGYDVTPTGLQWSSAWWQSVDKSRWQTCDVCGQLIPVVEDWVTRSEEVRTENPGKYKSDGTDIEPQETQPIKNSKRISTWTYVCPFCGHGHLGTPGDCPDLRAQLTCHECGTDLGADFQCGKCSFPRAWLTVSCPYCSNRQPVYAPHWVVHCDMFLLECVKCERVFRSLCIC